MIDFFAQFSPALLALCAGVVVVAIVQIVYLLRYAQIATHRHKRRQRKSEPLPPVSVIVVVADDPEYILEKLPRLLTQHHPDYEVVVVDDGSVQDLTTELLAVQQQYPDRLRYTTIKADPVFRHSRKLALTVGIKAARHERMIFIDPDGWPSSDKWLSLMARGFNGGGVVIGYTGIEKRKGAVNGWIRCDRLSRSIRFLSAAIHRHPYRGMYNNLGYTKSLFFRNKGFTHLRMTLGEDDLFVQSVAPWCDTSVILNPQATVWQEQRGGLRWWWNEQIYRSGTFSLFPARVKAGQFTDLLTRTLLLAGAITLALLQTPVLWMVGVGAWVLREALLLVTLRMIMQRLGERKLAWYYFVHDLYLPVGELLLWINRTLKPSQRIWI